MKFELRQHFQIESARWLPRLPSSHPCSRMHGHSFKIILRLQAPLDPVLEWVMDYSDVAALFTPILREIDHRVLNEVPGLENPTSEVLARWLFTRGLAVLPSLVQVVVLETAATECAFPAL